LLDWTQPDLAKAAGIALATLKRFEQGHCTPNSGDRRAALFTALEHGGVQLEDDEKQLVVAISARKLPK
jgi:transcriptional regulator with XRE-family HTH domain